MIFRLTKLLFVSRAIAEFISMTELFLIIILFCTFRLRTIDLPLCLSESYLTLLILLVCSSN